MLSYQTKKATRLALTRPWIPKRGVILSFQMREQGVHLCRGVPRRIQARLRGGPTLAWGQADEAIG